MTTPASDTRPLGMTEAYHATQKWLTFVGEPTIRIEDPTDGVLQLHTERHMVRVRVGPDAAGQGAVIAMMRAAAEIADLDVAMFSPTGYNPSALEFAEIRGIALFTLTPLGDVKGETVAARAMMPDREFIPPFSERAFALVEPLIDEDQPGKDAETEDVATTVIEWTNCPRCGMGQHPDLDACAACGAELDPDAPEQGPEVGDTAIHGASAPEITYSLRCNSCGSHDVELTRH